MQLAEEQLTKYYWCLQVEVSEFIYIGLFKIQIRSYLKPTNKPTNHKTNTPPPQKPNKIPLPK